MYLYFEDWSGWLPSLDEKEIPHGNRIIKVFPSEADPQKTLEKPNLAIVESPDRPFSDNEIFSYPGRETYTGKQIETMITDLRLSELGERVVRALFRFSNDPKLLFCQAGMSIKKEDGTWLIDNPLQDIDGLREAAADPDGRSLCIHLDIFVPKSLERLDELIDFRKSEEHLVNFRDRLRLKRFEGGRKQGVEKE